MQTRSKLQLLIGSLTFVIAVGHFPASQVDASPACHLNAQEQELARLMTYESGQHRPTLECHPILAGVARVRAWDMANRGYIGHVTPEGYGPNFLVRQAGYDLPAQWSKDPKANYIESISAGHVTPLDAWKGLLKSEGHRRHALAEDPFFRTQVMYGVGYVEASGSQFVRYYVIITAPRQQVHQTQLPTQ
jgi:hypothetical protein